MWKYIWNLLAPEQDYNSQTLISNSQKKDRVDEIDPGQHENTLCYKKMPLTF